MQQIINPKCPEASGRDLGSTGVVRKLAFQDYLLMRGGGPTEIEMRCVEEVAEHIGM